MPTHQQSSTPASSAAAPAVDVVTGSGPGNALLSQMLGGGESSASASSEPAAELATLGSDPTEIARSSRSEELVRHTVTNGEGTAELRDIMRRLQSAPSLEAARADLERLAVLRGDTDTSTIEEHYNRFLVQRAADLEVDGSFEALDEERHPEFMASPEQLAYGRVVGESMGMDPVLASLLNPTGGLVGPGNNAVARDRDSSIGTHGIVHDAMGYLFNHGGTGPGYDYLGGDMAEPVLGTGNPLVGQESGTGFWSEYDGTSGAAQGGDAILGIGGTFVEDGVAAAGEAADWAGGKLGEATSWAGDRVDGLMDGASAAADEIGSWFD